jgi:hypothetical protein
MTICEPAGTKSSVTIRYSRVFSITKKFKVI